MADFVKGKRLGRDGGETDGGGETSGDVPELQPLGNAAVAASLPQQADPGAAAACSGYEVEQGDTLWDIARRHLGDGSRWQEIYDRNVDEVGANPDLILPGQNLDLCEQAVEEGVEAEDVEVAQCIEEDAEAAQCLETGEGDNAITEAAEEQPPATFVDVATDMFSGLAGEDGYLSSDDLDAAMTNPDLTLEQSAALVTMRRLQDQLEELSNDEFLDENSGITMADLEEYRRTGELPDSEHTPDTWFAHYKGQMNGFSQELFANGVPDVNAIDQGGIGDCYFLAALGSAVAQDPQAVADMITPEEDGTYTVTFPNGESANVAAPTLAEMATYGNSGSDGMWVTLFERAGGATRDPDATLLPEELDGGSIAGRAGTDFFSGDGSSNVDMLSLTDNDTTRDRMQSAFEDGRVVIAGINNDLLDDNREGLPDAHAYSILGYDRENDTVTIRNPHARNEHDDAAGNPRDGTDDGTFTLSMTEFNRLFSSVSYSDAAFAGDD